MPGIVPVSGNLSKEDLAATLTRHEQLTFEQVTGLSIDPTPDPATPRNLVTTVAQAHQLGPIDIHTSGETCPGTKILSTTVYILGVKTAVDVFRMPLQAARPVEHLKAEADPDAGREAEFGSGSDAHRVASPTHHVLATREAPGDRQPDAAAPGVHAPKSPAHSENSADQAGKSPDQARKSTHAEPSFEDIEADPSPS